MTWLHQHLWSCAVCAIFFWESLFGAWTMLACDSRILQFLVLGMRCTCVGAVVWTMEGGFCLSISVFVRFCLRSMAEGMRAVGMFQCRARVCVLQRTRVAIVQYVHIAFARGVDAFFMRVAFPPAHVVGFCAPCMFVAHVPFYRKHLHLLGSVVFKWWSVWEWYPFRTPLALMCVGVVFLTYSEREWCFVWPVLVFFFFDLWVVRGRLFGWSGMFELWKRMNVAKLCLIVLKGFV